MDTADRVAYPAINKDSLRAMILPSREDDSCEAGNHGTAMSSSIVPLCVELDGTLSPVATLHESIISLARNSPGALLLLPLWWRRAGVNLKHEVAVRAQFDASHLPLHSTLLEWLKDQKAGGRRLILVSGTDPSIATSIAATSGLFDEILYPELGGECNRGRQCYGKTLVERFGERGFDYVGSHDTAAAVWMSARKAIVLGNDFQVERVQTLIEVERRFRPVAPTFVSWLKAIRLHQWAKNTLIFLPALLAHAILHSQVLIASVLAFFSFSLCASSIYVVNDLFDLTSDRRHPRKRNRPFAAGILSARSGIVVSLALLGVSVCLACWVGSRFVAVLSTYYAVTWAYSLRLKRAALVDVMTLASLYTLRIIAGGAATMIQLSFWLLAFSIFIFLSLAIVKRYTEINEASQAGGVTIHGRGYRTADLPLLLNLGVAAGYCTVVVMALYINSMDATLIYHRTKPLWLICPLLLYWISRIWLLATRGQMPDDPVVFAIRDRISLVILGLVASIVLLSI